MTFYQQLTQATQPEREELLASPIICKALEGGISLEDYIAFLTQAYHHVKHTVPLLMALGAKLPTSQEWIRRAVAHYISEEIGHEEWILNDIAACGGDRDAQKNSVPTPATELMVAYAYDTIHRGNPLGFFGMVYVLEGTSTAIAKRAADSIGRQLKLPTHAFTYLDSHGALDIEHMDFFENIINRIEDPDDRRQIIHSAKMFFSLYGNIFRTLAAPKLDTHQEACPA